MNTSRRRFMRVAVVLPALALALAACGGGGGGGGGTAAGCGDGVKLGFFGALTGDNAALGINIRNGVDLALRQYSATNPQCKVTLAPFDSQGSESAAPGLAQQAINDQKVVAVVGPAFSGESKAANPLFNEAGLPIVTPSATNPALADNGWSIFHRAVGNDNSQGPAAAAYIKSSLKASKVAVVDDKTEYGKGIADIVRQQLGSAVTFNDSVPQQTQDYSSTVTGVKNSGATVLFYGGYYADGGRLLKQLRDSGLNATFVSDDGAKDDNFIRTAGRAAAEGAFITCPCAPPEQVKNGQKFIADYKAAFGADPGTYSAEGYDAANVVLEAIKAGKYDRKAINDFLSSVDFQGITKEIKFDSKGEVSEKTIYMYEVKNGVIAGQGAVQSQ
ncbi:MAG TPA: branched-chain amino acid ABC transporter substrate-binding protein [Actinomycetes bacterium]|nr:branched-chain amino acid ABC transporter substrate-binding protein [Actinomycetes bacterium]